MDTGTGEVWPPLVTDSAEKKLEENRLDELTDTERRYLLAQAAKRVAWISPEVAERLRAGEDAKLKDEFERVKNEMENRG